VDEGEEVDLNKWPTKIDPVCKSKSQYKQDSLVVRHRISCAGRVRL
jgi:hypothetical protein